MEYVKRIQFAALIVPLIVLFGCRTGGQRSDASVEKDTWLLSYDSSNVGLSKEWYSPSYDRSGWRSASSGYWLEVDGQQYEGVGWYASTFSIADSSIPLSIFFGGIDDEGIVWVNGKQIGSHTEYDESFFLDLRELHQGTNSVVVRVINHGGPGGIYKPAQIVKSSEVKKLLKTKFADETARESVNWVRDAVIYEVYLRSFSKEGTLKALEKRLPEL